MDEGKLKIINFKINLIFVLLILGAFYVVWGNSDLNINNSNYSKGNLKNEETLSDLNYAEEASKHLSGQVSFTAIITELRENSFDAKAILVDLEKLKTVDFSKHSQLPNLEKNITITINDNTNILSREILKIGNRVNIFADRSPYEYSDVTAVSISNF